ncbi:hypothetical protein [Methanobrevibacter curvatus]|uniref:Uncharacterized protein n=1 Tax=Methanobrevibacter curvatus TaxID=49547 RepID=A0A166AW86_9EURY|nr:hypothetical protein [Methanobrevibacter curvatus]KZX12546.1 hypothetical protein MBCUR_10360 [Methanobrevibacter curvatus]
MVEKNIGLGRGLDSLIPKIDENDETSYTLEEILNNSKGENKEEEEVEEKTEDTKDNTEKNDTSSKKAVSKKKTAKKAKKSTSTKTTKKTSKSKNENKKNKENKKTDKIATDENIETSLPQDQDNDLKSTNLKPTNDSKNIESDVSQDLSIDPIVESNVNDVKKVIGKNPRITLWSVKSAAVLRYLRKTKPEFSISKEASELIDEAISNKYPEIWELFEDLENEK